MRNNKQLVMLIFFVGFGIDIMIRRLGYDSIKNNDINEIIGIIKDTTGYKDNDYFAAELLPS